MESPNVSTEITIENPYWSEVRSLFANKKHISNKEYYQWIIKHAEAREKCCRSYAFAIADPASVAFVANHIGPRAIEIGAGTGYWAWQLSQHGVDIKAFDIAPPDRMPNFYFTPETQQLPKPFAKIWHPIAHGSPEVLAEHLDRTLLLCWPPLSNPMAHECLQAYQGQRLVYIGEGDGGCTGNDDFFNLLEEQWKIVAEHQIVQWDSIHDEITVYERNNK